MLALEQDITWDLVQLPFRKSHVGYHWGYTVNVNTDGSVACLKVRLSTKGYSQTYSVDYLETFSHVCQNDFCSTSYLSCCFKWLGFLSVFVRCFLHGDLEEKLYMEQLSRFVALGETRMVCKLEKFLLDKKNLLVSGLVDFL